MRKCCFVIFDVRSVVHSVGTGLCNCIGGYVEAYVASLVLAS